MADHPNRTVKSVRTACRIIDALEEHGGAGVTELAGEVGIAKSAVHKHLATLLDAEYVRKDGTTYHLSLRHLGLGTHVKARIPKYEAIEKGVDGLSEECRETVQFAVEEHGWAVSVAKSKGQFGLDSVSYVGKREHLHATSLGKAILAELPSDRIDQIVDRRGLPAKTSATITDREELDDELELIRERGYAVDHEENTVGLQCVGAPVSSDRDGVLGAISVTGPSRWLTPERIEEELAEKVVRAANTIEMN